VYVATREVMCMCVREGAGYRHFDPSLIHIHITVRAWYRHFDISLTHIHITERGIEVSVPSHESDVYVC
jgi:hypothetical protein